MPERIVDGRGLAQAGFEKIASYVGLVPAEESSRDRRRLGHISNAGWRAEGISGWIGRWICNEAGHERVGFGDFSGADRGM